MSQTATKLISFRVDPVLYKLINEKAKSEHRPVSNYIKKIVIEDLDATEYLLSTEANKNKMYKMLEKNKAENLLIFNNIEEIKQYVQNLAD